MEVIPHVIFSADFQTESRNISQSAVISISIVYQVNTWTEYHCSVREQAGNFDV